MPRPVTFLSDYGLADEFVGVVHAVIARICPGAPIIDLGHDRPAQAVVPAALSLEAALPFCPPGVHLAVVDPGVGGPRRALALRCATEDRLLVGPDNGLLWPAAERFGGVAEAVEISASPWRLVPVSATFHGRDVFAPVAARLAAGAPLREAGAAIDPAEVERLALPAARRDPDGALVVPVLAVDGFGTLALGVSEAELDSAVGARGLLAGGREVVRGRTFSDAPPGGLVLYEDAAGRLALAERDGSAAEALGVAAGDEVRLAAISPPGRATLSPSPR